MKDYLILHMIALAVGICLDLCLGDPHTLPHPIRAMGRLILALERSLMPEGRVLSREKQRLSGFVLWLTVVLVCFISCAGIIVISAIIHKTVFLAADAVLIWYCLAARSLRDESMKVYDCLRRGDIYGARLALSMIVGRDTDRLDEPGIVKAAVETVAENTSDGVIAPLVYTAVLGPCAGLCYKAVNTMDSMIGYKNDRYEHFGRFAARADDVANYPMSRLSALLMIAATWLLGAFGNKHLDVERAWHIWRRDRRRHTSPNSAQTESVCAGALHLRLGGSSYYNGVLMDKPYIGDSLRSPDPEDIKRAVKLMFATEAICTAVIFTIMILIWIFP